MSSLDFVPLLKYFNNYAFPIFSDSTFVRMHLFLFYFCLFCSMASMLF